MIWKDSPYYGCKGWESTEEHLSNNKTFQIIESQMPTDFTLYVKLKNGTSYYEEIGRYNTFDKANTVACLIDEGMKE